MKPMLLIAAALVLPLVWGYLAEQLMRRIWPQPPRGSRPDDRESSLPKNEPPTQYLDYQI